LASSREKLASSHLKRWSAVAYGIKSWNQAVTPSAFVRDWARVMPSGRAIARLSVSQNAHVKPAVTAWCSARASMRRAAPVISVASNGWK
jgi:hypothetical protein